MEKVIYSQDKQVARQAFQSLSLKMISAGSSWDDQQASAWIMAMHDDQVIGLMSYGRPYSHTGHIYWCGIDPDHLSIMSKIVSFLINRLDRSDAMTITVIMPEHHVLYDIYCQSGFMPLVPMPDNQVCLSQSIDPWRMTEYLDNDARDFGFEWPHIDAVIEQIISECHEVQDAITNETQERVQEEVGDVLLTAISLALFVRCDPFSTIVQANKKFAARMHAVKTITHEKGHSSLAGLPTNYALEIWSLAKTRCYVSQPAVDAE